MMYKHLMGVVLLAAAIGCAKSAAVTSGSGGVASASDSVILVGGHASMMLQQGSPIQVGPTAVASLSDSVIIIGGHTKTKVLVNPSASSSLPSTGSDTIPIACRVVVHDATPVSTPPKYVFVVSC
jgi:hypothetical protein